jgi:hypothetical protein
MARIAPSNINFLIHLPPVKDCHQYFLNPNTLG